MNSIESIGENIRISRLKNGLSQEQLALNAGVNTSYIGQIKRGKKNPTIKTLDKISKALGIALIDLLLFVDSKGGGSTTLCSQSSAVLTPEQIKQSYLKS
ncbi:helix-turn-helix domain-containing protein [Paenibacillus sp. GCM10012306]|uniref:helix-turn-helix domain-containing protein n=1 Tax=Paenibacillus sp. GCM10012306 TaxID=3317342 RepID=UPI0036158C63